MGMEKGLHTPVHHPAALDSCNHNYFKGHSSLNRGLVGDCGRPGLLAVITKGFVELDDCKELIELGQDQSGLGRIDAEDSMPAPT